ncbi:hypothetical protein V7S43_014391 [Phytophthora oleae]|uniref:Uncharacterized protein n=1 Tax=Phytophthora oleae TaxID=2107226 RepID=A0ABD3F2B4_9STRA
MPLHDRMHSLESSEDRDCDLLQILDVASKRERQRERQRESQMRKKSKIADANQRRAAEIEHHTADQRFLHPISQQDQDRCLHLLQEALEPQGLDECPCMVCDRLVLR